MVNTGWYTLKKKLAETQCIIKFYSLFLKELTTSFDYTMCAKQLVNKYVLHRARKWWKEETLVRTTMTLILLKFCRKKILFSTLSQIVTWYYAERWCNVVLVLPKKGVAEYSVSRSYAKHVIKIAFGKKTCCRTLFQQLPTFSLLQIECGHTGYDCKEVWLRQRHFGKIELRYTLSQLDGLSPCCIKRLTASV